MLKIRLAAVALGAALGLCSVVAPVRAQTILDGSLASDPRIVEREFRGLLDPTLDPSVFTFAWGTSANGTYVAGQSATSDCPVGSDCIRAAVWTPFSTDVPFLLPGIDNYPGGASGYYALARAIDADGDTLVGREEVCIGFNCPVMSRALAWTRTGPTWSPTTTTVTELLPSLLFSNAGARGISDDGQFAVGWMTNNFIAFQATLWARTGPTSWTMGAELGALAAGESSGANGVAVDANGSPVVVGWSGTPGGGTFGRDGSDWPANVFDTGTNVKPVVWTPGSMQPLPMLPDPDQRGDATAISADANTIVGWSADSSLASNDDIPSTQAVRWTRQGSGWSAAQPLGTFELPSEIAAQFDNPRELFGSVALAVSETGAAIVGYQAFGSISGGGSALNFDVTLALIWTQALGSARYLGDVLTEAGVSLGDWVLFTATGVRETEDSFVVVGDGCADGVDDCFRLPARPGYIARIGRTPDSPSGITTPEEQILSFSEISSAVLLAASGVGSTLTGLNDTAENHRCIRPDGGPAGNWCFFAFGTGALFRGDIDGEVDGDRFSGEVGIAHYFTPVTSIAASVGAGVTDSDLDLGGHYHANDFRVGGYAAHIPDQGFRAFFGGVWGDLSDIDLARGYLNGLGLAQSFGSTEGEAWGLLGRLGYGVRAGAATWVTPFVEIAFTEASFDGYREQSGPFYATFEAIEANTTTGRLGVLHEQDLSATLRVYMSAAWAHVLDADVPVTRGAVLDIFELTAVGGNGLQDWAEFMAGARSQVSERGVISVTGRIGTEFDDFFSMGGRVGYSHIF